MLGSVANACLALGLPALLAAGWFAWWVDGPSAVIAWHLLVEVGPVLGLAGAAVAVAGWRRRAGHATRLRSFTLTLNLVACAIALAPGASMFGMPIPSHESSASVSIGPPTVCGSAAGEPIAGRTPDEHQVWLFHSTTQADWRSKEDDPCWGTPVVSPSAGRVHDVHDGVSDGEPGNPGEGLGNTVRIELADGTFLLIAHLREHSVVVTPGEAVGEGALLAQLGSSGDASSPEVYLRRERALPTSWTGWVESLPVQFPDGRTVAYPGAPDAALEIDFADPPAVPTCDGNADCPTDRLCARLGNGQLHVLGCVPHPDPAANLYRLPLVAAGVRCGQGYDQLDHTHSYPNTLFAVDLSSPRDGTAGEVVAAADGVVANVFSGCVDPGVVTGHGDSCGGGFGNAVLVAHANGEATAYAHLARVDVELGQHLLAGEHIGTEGITGAAGERHLHFSVHRIDGAPSADGNGWPSIPFSLTFRRTLGGPLVQWPAAELPCDEMLAGEAVYPP